MRRSRLRPASAFPRRWAPPPSTYVRAVAGHRVDDAVARRALPILLRPLVVPLRRLREVQPPYKGISGIG